MLARFDVIGSVDRARHRRNRRLVQHVVDARDGASRDVEVGEVALEELDARDVREVAALAGDQAVDDADALAAADELFREVGADEAGAAGDEI